MPIPLFPLEPPASKSGGSDTVVELAHATLTHYCCQMLVMFRPYSRPWYYHSARNGPRLVFRPESYNDDLYMSSLTQSQTVWTGDQKKRGPYITQSAVSHADHAQKALLQPPRLATPAPLPEELSASIKFNRGAPGPSILSHWSVQLRAVKELAQAS